MKKIQNQNDKEIRKIPSCLIKAYGKEEDDVISFKKDELYEYLHARDSAIVKAVVSRITNVNFSTDDVQSEGLNILSELEGGNHDQ